VERGFGGYIQLHFVKLGGGLAEIVPGGDELILGCSWRFGGLGRRHGLRRGGHGNQKRGKLSSGHRYEDTTAAKFGNEVYVTVLRDPQ